MSFQNCSYTDTPRSSALVPTTTDVPFGVVANTLGGCIFWVVAISGRTTGTLTATPLGSFDGTTYFSLGASQSVSSSGNGNLGLPVTGATPRYVGLRLEPTGGFDGAARVDLYSSGPAVSA